jgi:hypothetical protein
LVDLCSYFLCLNNYFHFKQIFERTQIWLTSDSNNRIKWVKNDIYVVYSNFKTFFHEIKRNLEHLWLGDTSMIVCPNDLKFLKNANKVWKLWDV